MEGPGDDLGEMAARLLADGRAAKRAAVEDAEALLAHARSLQAAGADAFWELGGFLGELAKRRIHILLGFARFEQLVAARLGMSKSLAWRLIAVASRLPRDEAMRLGQERAHALLSYAAASRGAVDPVEVARLDLPIVGDRPISETPVREILAARPRRPKLVAGRTTDDGDTALAAAVKRRAAALGLRVNDVEVRGGSVVLTLSRARAQRFAEGGRE